MAILWINAATLLVAAEIKVVLVDFGSLGEIEGTLAVIAAGSVFMVMMAGANASDG